MSPTNNLQFSPFTLKLTLLKINLLNTTTTVNDTFLHVKIYLQIKKEQNVFPYIYVVKKKQTTKQNKIQLCSLSMN